MKLDDLPTNDDIDAGTWREVFPGEYSAYSGTYSVHDGARVEDVTPERIARIDAWWGQSPEGYASTDLVALVELSDGTWAACMAWCDTTGWDCQSDVQWKWARTRDEAVTSGLDRSAREHLGLSLAGETR